MNLIIACAVLILIPLFFLILSIMGLVLTFTSYFRYKTSYQQMLNVILHNAHFKKETPPLPPTNRKTKPFSVIRNK